MSKGRKWGTIRIIIVFTQTQKEYAFEGTEERFHEIVRSAMQ